jgi:hypothetical protein
MADTKTEFERASQEGRESIVAEFVYFLKTNKKWWLLPILLMMALVGAAVLAGGTGFAPFIYTLF